MGFFYGDIMTILEKIDFEPGSGKYESAVTLLNNQSNVECSDNLKDFFMNATVSFLKNSIINDVMQVQPLEELQGILHYLRCTKPDDNSVSLQILEDNITIDTHEDNTVYQLERLQDAVTSDDYKNMILESYSEFENRILQEIVEHSNIILTFNKDYNNDKLILFISEECNDIARRTRRGTGNIVVMSTDIFNIINNSPLVQLKDDGYYYLMNNIKIRIHAALGDNILLGYNSSNNLLKGNVDGGGFFIPYRLFDNIRIILNNNTLEPELYYSSTYTTRFYDADKYYTTITLV